MVKRYLTRQRGTPAPSPDQLKEQECIDAAVKEGIAVIKPWVAANPARLLKSLTKAEMDSLAWAMVSKWIVSRSELESEMPNDAIDDLWRNDGTDNQDRNAGAGSAGGGIPAEVLRLFE